MNVEARIGRHGYFNASVDGMAHWEKLPKRDLARMCRDAFTSATSPKRELTLKHWMDQPKTVLVLIVADCYSIPHNHW